MKRTTSGQSCCTTPSAMYFWAAIFAVFYGASLLLGIVWPELRHYGGSLTSGLWPQPASSILVGTGRFTAV